MNTVNSISKIIQREEARQLNEINLIASENIVSKTVLEAMGSVLTNKYAEGYPQKRWYNGCDVVDDAESLAQDLAQKIFHADYANVQPHSGSQANMAAYFSLAPVGSTVLAMDLAHGGHLTHGSSANFSGRLYSIVPYGVSKETEQIDYDEVQKLAEKYRPQLLIAGASAYARTLDFKRFSEIADSVGAKFLVDMAHIAGLVAAGVHPNPVPYADIVTSTTHKTLRGPRGGLILAKEKYAKKINSQVFPGIQGGPFMHIILAKAAAFQEASGPSFKAYQQQVIAHAKQLANDLEKGGLRIVSGGTDNHLFMADVTSTGLTGAEAADKLQNVGIVVNKNAIPFDQKKITETSGIRIGTPLVTSRGFSTNEFQMIAKWILAALQDENPEQIKKEISELCHLFPIYPVSK